jgi:anti-anti-sigma regulatory factor
LQSGEVFAGCEDKTFYLRMTGDVRLTWSVSLEDYCRHVFQTQAIEFVLIDLCQVKNLDSTTLGILAKIAIAAKADLGRMPEIYLQDADIERLLMSMGFNAIFVPQLPRLPLLDASASEMQETVIDAHRTLMDMNKQNSDQFESLVSTLKSDRDKSGPAS